MIALVDPHGTRQRSSNGLELRALLQQLVGQPFLFARFSYGDELTLHFGKATSYRNPKLRGLRSGSYSFGARASEWFLCTEPAVLVGTQESMRRPRNVAAVTGDEIERSRLLRPGARVVAIDAIPLRTARGALYGFGLSMLFSDGPALVVLPRPPRRRSTARQDDIADWEIFLPHHRYLAVGPGRRWSYLPSDVPANGSR